MAQGGAASPTPSAASDNLTLGLSEVYPIKARGESDEQGPHAVERLFNDKGFFALFLLVVGFVVFLAAVAILNGPGELEKVPRVYDYDGRACGADLAESKVLLWWPRGEIVFFADEDATYNRVCASRCPEEGSVLCLGPDGTAVENGTDASCQTDTLEWSTGTVKRFGRCFSDVEYCDDLTLQHELDELNSISTLEVVTRSLQDMWHSRGLILVCGCAFPVAASTMLMRWIGKARRDKTRFMIALPQVLAAMALSALPFVAITVLNSELKGFYDCYDVDDAMVKNMSLVSMGLLGFAVLLGLSVWYNRLQLRHTSALAIETAKCVRAIRESTATVAFCSLLCCGVAVAWLGVGSYVLAWALELEAREKMASNVRIALTVSFCLGFLWIASFTGAVIRLTVAGAVADWYFQPKPRDAGKCFRLALQRTLFKHLGSAAKGSLLIPTLSLWRSIYGACRSMYMGFAYVRRKLFGSRKAKVAQGEDLGSFDGNTGARQTQEKRSETGSKRLHVVSRRAYNGVALHGESLIESGYAVCEILHKNAYRAGRCYGLMSHVNVIMSYLVVVACLCVAIVGDANFQGMNALGKGREIPLGLIFCVLVTSFAAVQGAFASFHQAASALVFCFVEDVEENDGTPFRPYYATKGLKDLMGTLHEDAFALTRHSKGQGLGLDEEKGTKRSLVKRLLSLLCFGAGREGG